MKDCSLQDVLAVRDQRRRTQEVLLARWCKPLVCFTMNIAGPRKRSALIDLAFHSGVERLRTTLGPFLYELADSCDAGSTFYGILNIDAPQAKKLAEQLERDDAVGRLFDMDIIQASGEKLSRAVPRTCLVCGGPVGVCARSRAHGLDAIAAETERILREFAAEQLAVLAVNSLIEEVHVTPKPGLVDENNSGAHSDMDLSLFEVSARSLRSYFSQAVLLGMASADCMPALQAAGLRAERVMFSATAGVNTHKGAIYTYGLLLAGWGRFLVSGEAPFSTAAALAAKGHVSEALTHGSFVRARYGISGARDEAIAGFPHVRSALRLLKRGMPPSIVLMHLIIESPDTNLYYRGGTEGNDFAVSAARAVLDAAPEYRDELLLRADTAFISRNLSPGGCADLLAAALFLHRLESILTALPPQVKRSES